MAWPRETYDVGQLSLCDQVLCLGPDKFLLELDNLGTFGLLVLQLRYFIRDLSLVIPARLHRALGVPNLLQDAAIIFQVLREYILLLAQLRQENA